MVNARHKFQTIEQGIHLPISYSYADTTERESATGFVTADVYKFAIQTNNNSLWMLISTAPTWQQINSGSASLQTLKETLALGNVTDGYNIEVSLGDSITFGTDPAIGGVIRLSNGDSIFFNNNVGGTDILLIGSDGYNNVLIGDEFTNAIYLGTTKWQSDPTLGASQDGYVATWVNADGQVEWKPASSSVTLGGDVTGPSSSNTVVKLQNITLSSSAPSDGYALIYDSGTSTWVTTGHQLDIGGNSIKFGVLSANTGAIRFKNNDTIQFLKTDGTTNLFLIGVASDNAAYMGDAANAATYIRSGGSIGLRPTGAGSDEYSFNSSVANFTNNALQFGTNPANAGTIRLPASAGSQIVFRNNGNSADIQGLFSGTDDVIYLGDSTNSVGMNLRVKTAGFVNILVNAVAEYVFDASLANFTNNHLGFGSSGTQATDGYINFTQNAGRLISARNYDNTGTQEILNLAGNTTFTDLRIGDESSKGTNTNYYRAKSQHILSINGTSEYTFGSTIADFKTNIIALQAIAVPSNPASGFYVFVDTADGELKALSSTGILTTIAPN